MTFGEATEVVSEGNGSDLDCIPAPNNENLRNQTQMGGVLLYWLRTCIGHSSGKAFDDFGTFFNADDPAIQRNMIVGGIAPLHIRVETVISSAALILLL